jgi:uncharacterized delta-60 repeat protein
MKAIVLFFMLWFSGCGLWSGVELTPSSSELFLASGSTIGPNGGAIASLNQKASVTIPKGALKTDTVITIDETSQQSAGNETAYRFGPEGTRFDLPVTIAIGYDVSKLPAGVRESDLRLGKFVGGRWEEVQGSTAFTSAKKVRGVTNSFSIYGVIVVDKTVLPAPTDVIALASDQTVTLSWSLVSGATAYHIYMGTSTLITNRSYDMRHENLQSPPFTHSGLVNGTTYYFIVAAVNHSSIEGSPSQKVSATPIAAVIPTVTLAVGNVILNEMGGTTTVTAILSTVTTLDVTVSLTVNPIGSASSTDYMISTSTITILGGGRSGSVTLTASEDILNEANETVTLDIGAVINGVIGSPSQQTVTLINDNGLIVRDSTFGQGGKVTTVIETADNRGYALVRQGDGKLVVAGSCMMSANSPANFCLARYHPNGNLDETFGNLGRVTTAISNVRDLANALAVQPDGKLVAAGYCYAAGYDDFCMVRYHSDGRLDTTFGNGGKVTTPLGAHSDIANEMILQPDGKIVTAGYCYTGNNDFCMARYDSSGMIDFNFGNSGKVITAIGTSDDHINALMLQSDGKLIAAGYCSGGNNDFCMARYNANGNIDMTFGSVGKVITSIGSGNDQVNALILQSDGKLVAAGSCYGGGNNDFCMARYDANGSLDITFGSAGKVISGIGSGNDQINALILQSNGKLIAGGGCDTGINDDFCVARYDASGNLDITFGINGKITTDFSAGFDVATSMILQPDGKLVAAGYCDIAGTNRFCLARFGSITE